jgi:hypothetical protein
MKKQKNKMPNSPIELAIWTSNAAPVGHGTYTYHKIPSKTKKIHSILIMRYLEEKKLPSQADQDMYLK